MRKKNDIPQPVIVSPLKSKYFSPGVVICTTVLVSSHALWAQQPVTPVADSARLATITTDTGAFSEHRDFSHYTTVGLCRAAALNARAGFQNGVVLEAQVLAQYLRDSTAIGFVGDKDTVGAGATGAIARACGARFTLANVAAQDHNVLFQLALFEQNDSLAQSVLAHVVASETTDENKWLDWKAGFNNMVTLGHRLAAEALLARFDTGGQAARRLQHELRRRLILADSTKGTAELRQAADQEIAQAKSGVDTVNADMSVDISKAIETAYAVLIRTAAIEYPDSIPAIALRAKRDLDGRTREGSLTPWKDMQSDEIANDLAPGWYRNIVRHRQAPQRASQVHADYWVSAPDRASSDTVRPVLGKVNVICDGAMPTPFFNDVVVGGGPSGQRAQAVYAQRVMRKYQAAGVVFTMVQKTRGYISGLRLDLNYDNNSYMTTPEEEVRLWKYYWQVYRQWPMMTLAIQVLHEDRYPLPDGRRKSVLGGSVANGIEYNNNRPVSGGVCTVIGRDGTTLYENSWKLYQDDEVRRAIDWALRWGPDASHSLDVNDAAVRVPSPASGSRASAPTATASEPVR